MVEVESVTGKITIDASGAVQGYQQAGEAAQQFGTDAETSSETIDESNQQVVTSTQAVGTATTATTGSFKDAALGSANLATAGISLYYTMDQVEQAQLKLDKANKTSEADAISLKTAQDNYNESVAQYGPDSQQATDAADKLKVAQDAYDNSLSAIKLDQDHYNETRMMTAVTVIPSLITGISGAVKTYQTLKDLDMSGTLGGITQAIGNNKDALVGAFAAGGGFFAMYEAFNSKDPTTRAEFSLLGGALITVAIAEWAVAAGAIAAEEILTFGGATALIAVALGAAAAIYVAASTFGAGGGSSSPPGSDQLSNTSSTATSGGSSSSASSGSDLNSVSAVQNAFGVTKVADNNWKQTNGVPISSAEADWFQSRGYSFNGSSQSWTKGSNITINVNGAQDADITANHVANALKNAGM